MFQKEGIHAAFGRNPYFIGILSAIFQTLKKFKDLKSRNPYFIGILSAIKTQETTIQKVVKSQSLFYWNPFCNKRAFRNKWLGLPMSQSLFYWNPFCNKEFELEDMIHFFKSQSLFYWNPFCNIRECRRV